MVSIENLKELGQLGLSTSLSVSTTESLDSPRAGVVHLLKEGGGKSEEVAILQQKVVLLDSEVSQLSSERNQLFTQLADLKQILKRLAKEASADCLTSSKALKSLKTKADAMKRALLVAEDNGGHLDKTAELWKELELS